MSSLLENPVYHALMSRDSYFNLGTRGVVFFDPLVSPFAGFDENNEKGFEELGAQLPAGRRILFAKPIRIKEPKGWKIMAEIVGQQFILEKHITPQPYAIEIVPLGNEHIEEMIALTALTKPGPFDKRTIEFGNYFGVFKDGRLVAMTGQRLHIGDYSEISAVCTHPDYLGKGYAAALLHHQVDLILHANQIPFLHVRADNDRAIDIYKRIGFKESRLMNFYYLKKY